MKKVYEESWRNWKVVVRGKNEYGEYVGKLYKDGKFVKESDYYSDDKEDCINSMKFEIERIIDNEWESDYEI